MLMYNIAAVGQTVLVHVDFIEQSTGQVYGTGSSTITRAPSSGLVAVAVAITQTLRYGEGYTMIARMSTVDAQGDALARIAQASLQNLVVRSTTTPMPTFPPDMMTFEMTVSDEFDLSSPTQRSALETTIIRELTSPSNKLNLVEADIVSITIYLKQNRRRDGRQVVVEVTLVASASVVSSTDILERRLQNCSFCVVFDGDVSCPHHINASACKNNTVGTTSECDTSPCHDGEVCRPLPVGESPGYECMCMDALGLYTACAAIRASSDNALSSALTLTTGLIAVAAASTCLLVTCAVVCLVTRLRSRRKAANKKGKMDQDDPETPFGGLKLGPAASMAASLEWDDEHKHHDPHELPDWLRAADALNYHNEAAHQLKRPMGSPEYPRSPGGKSMEWNESVHVASEFGSPGADARGGDTPIGSAPSRYLDDMDKYSSKSMDKLSARSETAEAVYRLMEERQQKKQLSASTSKSSVHTAAAPNTVGAPTLRRPSNVVPKTLRRDSSQPASAEERFGDGSVSERHGRTHGKDVDKTYDSALGLRHHSVKDGTKFLDPQETEDATSIVDAAVLNDHALGTAANTDEDHSTATLRPAATLHATAGGNGSAPSQPPVSSSTTSRAAARNPTYASAATGGPDSDRDGSWADTRKPTYMTARLDSDGDDYTMIGSSRGGVRHATYITAKQDSDSTTYTASTIAGLGGLAGRAYRDEPPSSRTSARMVTYLSVDGDLDGADDIDDAYRVRSRQETGQTASTLDDLGGLASKMTGQSLSLGDDDIYDVATLVTTDDEDDKAYRLQSRQGTEYTPSTLVNRQGVVASHDDEPTYALATPSVTGLSQDDEAGAHQRPHARVVSFAPAVEGHSDNDDDNDVDVEIATPTSVASDGCAVAVPEVLVDDDDDDNNSGDNHDQDEVEVHDVYTMATPSTVPSSTLGSLEGGDNVSAEHSQPSTTMNTSSQQLQLGKLFDRVDTMASSGTLAQLEQQVEEARKQLVGALDDEDGTDNVDLSFWEH